MKGRLRAEVVLGAWAWNPIVNVFIRKERKVQTREKACEDGGRSRDWSVSTSHPRARKESVLEASREAQRGHGFDFALLAPRAARERAHLRECQSPVYFGASGSHGTVPIAAATHPPNPGLEELTYMSAPLWSRKSSASHSLTPRPRPGCVPSGF